MNENFELNLVAGSVKGAMIGAKSADLWKVPLAKIKVMDGFNVRIKNAEHETQVRLIADSIKENGFFPDKPLAGFVAKENSENIIYVIDGHTRLEAVHLAISEGCEINEIPVVTKPAGTSMEDLTVALVVSNEGRHLTPFEIALVCKRLVGFGMDESEIARRFGRSKAHIANLLLLASAPRSIKSLVQEGKVSATLAVETYRAYGSQATEILERGMASAKEAGKDKVTSKHLAKKKKEATTPIVVATPINTILERGIKWINANDPQGAISTNLLAYLAQVSIEEVGMRLTPIPQFN